MKNLPTSVKNLLRLRGSEKAFTLVEIMVVLVIIGLLGTFLFGKIFSTAGKAKAKMTNLQLEALKQKVNEYRLMYNDLPSGLEDLTTCNQTTGPGCIPLLDQNDDALTDAWGNEFQYQRLGNNRRYKIMSLGEDGASGGDGVNFDFFIEGP